MIKLPERTCSACNCKGDKNSFLRVLREPAGNIIIDTTHKKNGRGAYVCPRKECIDRLKKSKRLERLLKVEIPEEVYSELYLLCGDK